MSSLHITRAKLCKARSTADTLALYGALNPSGCHLADNTSLQPRCGAFSSLITPCHEGCAITQSMYMYGVSYGVTCSNLRYPIPGNYTIPGNLRYHTTLHDTQASLRRTKSTPCVLLVRVSSLLPVSMLPTTISSITTPPCNAKWGPFQPPFASQDEDDTLLLLNGHLSWQGQSLVLGVKDTRSSKHNSAAGAA